MVRFKNTASQWHLHFVVYFDLESLIEPVDTVQDTPCKSRTVKVEKHEPCSFFLVAVEHDNPKTSSLQLKRDPDVMENIARDIYDQKRR